MVILGFTSCSNDDSVNEETLNPNVTGLSVDTSSGSSLSDRVLNFKSPGTRAVDYTTLSLGLITEMPSAPSVPNDAVDFTKVISSGNVSTASNSVYLASGKIYNGELDLGNKTYYISGDMTLKNVWGSGTIYILKGGSLNLNHSEGSLLNNQKATIYNYGTLATTASNFYIGGSETLYNEGNLDIPTQVFKCEGKVYVGGYLNAKGWEANQDERVNVVGNVTLADGGKLYLCTGRDGLKVFENGTLSWSYQPEKITTSKGLYKAYCNGVAFDSKYIYLAYGSFGLIVLDKTTHKVVAQRKMVKSANYVTLADGYIYVAYGRDCLQVFKLVE